MCTHATGLLADGWVEDGEIECPLHQARFDIRTGKALCEPATEDLRTYPVKVEGGDVLIDLERAGAAPEQASPTPAEPGDGEAGSGTTARSDDDRENRCEWRARDERERQRRPLREAIRVAGERSHAHPGLGLHRSGHLRPRGGAHLPRPHLELRGARSRAAQCRRFHPLQRGADARRRGARRGRLDQRVREPLPAPGGRILPRAQRHDQGVRLPLSSMDLQSQRRSHRRAVPARRCRQGRHARGLPAREPRPAQAQRHHPPRRRVRVLCGRRWSRSPTISAPRCCASSRRRSTAAS